MHSSFQIHSYSRDHAAPTMFCVLSSHFLGAFVSQLTTIYPSCLLYLENAYAPLNIPKVNPVNCNRLPIMIANLPIPQ